MIIFDADFLQSWKSNYETFSPANVAALTGGTIDLQTYGREMHIGQSRSQLSRRLQPAIWPRHGLRFRRGSPTGDRRRRTQESRPKKKSSSCKA